MLTYLINDSLKGYVCAFHCSPYPGIPIMWYIFDVTCWLTWWIISFCLGRHLPGFQTCWSRWRIFLFYLDLRSSVVFQGCLDLLGPHLSWREEKTSDESKRISRTDLLNSTGTSAAHLSITLTCVYKWWRHPRQGLRQKHPLWFPFILVTKSYVSTFS